MLCNLRKVVLLLYTTTKFKISLPNCQKRCANICVEHHLQRLTGETLLSSTLTENKVDLDICARDFWQTDRSATFFDASFFSPNTKRYANQDISKIFELNEKEKKRLYIERIIEIEHVHFTLLMMSATGGMSR